MIYAVNTENLDDFGDVLPKLFRLRYKEFRERQSYDVPVYKDMEFDQFDNVPTVYLVSLDNDRNLEGCVRLNPTSRPYMLEQIWPELLQNQIPKSNEIWEGTRFCINRNLDVNRRTRIKYELVLAHQEFGLANGIHKFIGLMPTFIWQRVFTASGWPALFLGPEVMIDGIRTRAAEGYVSEDVHNNIKKITGIYEPVLHSMIYTKVDKQTESKVA